MQKSQPKTIKMKKVANKSKCKMKHKKIFKYQNKIHKMMWFLMELYKMRNFKKKNRLKSNNMMRKVNKFNHFKIRYLSN